MDGRSYTQTATVRNDPRSPATAADLLAQHALMMRMTDAMKQSYDGNAAALALKADVDKAARSEAQADVAGLAASVEARLDSVSTGVPGAVPRGAKPVPTFSGVNRALTAQLNAQDAGDLAPHPSAVAAFAEQCRDLDAAARRFGEIVGKDLAALNAAIARHGGAALAAPAAVGGCRGAPAP